MTDDPTVTPQAQSLEEAFDELFYGGAKPPSIDVPDTPPDRASSSTADHGPIPPHTRGAGWNPRAWEEFDNRPA